MMFSRVYRDGALVDEQVTLENVKSLSSQEGAICWLDMVNPSRQEIDLLGSELGINDFHLDDAFKGRQRPKMDINGHYMFLNVYAVDFDLVSHQLVSHEIALIVTANELITIRDNADFDMSKITQHWDDYIQSGRAGIDFLLWGLLDVVVDGYFEALEGLDDRVELLEDFMLSDASPTKEQQRNTYDLRKSLVSLRRLILPMREITGPLISQDVLPVSKGVSLHFHDVHDHVLRVTDWTESLRDLITTLIETNLTMQSNRMNMIMKKVTSWAAIIAVPTAITGFYGQNIPYPGYGTQFGFWSSSVIIAGMSIGLYLVFKKKDWI